jgi:hypothetical protein
MMQTISDMTNRVEPASRRSILASRQNAPQKNRGEAGASFNVPRSGRRLNTFTVRLQDVRL